MKELYEKGIPRTDCERLDKALERLDEKTQPVCSMLLNMMSYIYQAPIQKKLITDLAEELNYTEVCNSEFHSAAV